MKYKNLIAITLAPTSMLFAQSDSDESEEIFELSPFTVTAETNEGYHASQTLAGTRLKTNVEDVASSIQILTEDFLDDVGADDLSDLFLYTTNTESAGLNGNFSDFSRGETSIGDEGSRTSPQSSQRVRGLAKADLTRNYFSTLIPSDRFNTQMVEINRGANSILYGLGSPAGIVNTTLKSASFEDAYSISHRFDSEGSQRVAIDLNKELIQDRLAIRVALLDDQGEYYQDPAYENDERIYLNVNARLWEGAGFRASYEEGERRANRPNLMPPANTIDHWFESNAQARQRMQSALDEGGILGSDGNPLQVPSDYVISYDAYAQDFYTGKYLTTADVNKDGTVDAADDSTRLALLMNRVAFHESADNRYLGHPNLSRGIMNVFHWDSPIAGGAAGGTDAIQTNINSKNFRPKVTGALPGALDPSGNKKFNYLYQATVQPWRTDPLLVPQGLNNLDTFDYTRNMISGTSAFQNDDWKQSNIAFEQTFFENNFGFELAFDEQEYSRESYVPFQGYTGIFIDLMKNYLGEANPNYGRPFVQARTSKRDLFDERETMRFTAFAKINPGELYPDSKIANWLGEHTFTGLFNDYDQSSSNTSWQKYYTDADGGSSFASTDVTGSGRRKYNYMVYLSDQNITELTSPDQVRLNPMGDISLWNPGQTSTIRTIDPETNELAPLTLTTGAFIDGFATSQEKVETTALNWNSYFFNRSLIGLVGWRKDEAYAASYFANTGSDNLADPSDMILNSGDETVDVETVSWSLVYHLPNRFLPENTRMTFHYGESENFSLGGRATDFFGELLESPAGETKEYGFTLGLMDSKLIARVNWFETDLLNRPLQGSNNVYSKYVNQGILKPYGFLLEAEHNGFEAPFLDPETEEIDPGTPNFDIAMDALADLRAIMPEALLREANVLSVDSNGIASRNDISVGDTDEVSSKGFELELTYNATKNWRLSLNAAKQQTIVNNFSPRMAELMALMNPIFGKDGKLANLRYFNNPENDPPQFISDPEPDNNSVAEWLEGNVYSIYRNKVSQEGRVSDEQRKWRVNFVTNYKFREGRFKGFDVGAAYRWQDGASIGYPTELVDGQLISDIENPHMSPGQTNVDAWVRYGRKIFNDRVKWSIEFRVMNLNTNADELIPVVAETTQDYNVAVYRVGSPRIWRIGNSFKF